MNRNHSLVTTISIWGEGDRESNFLKYLYRLYHNPKRKVTINNAHGGDPEAQIRQMLKHYALYEYDERYAIFDLDRGNESVKKAKQLAKNAGIICIMSDKNLEMELVRLITNDAKKLKQTKSSSKAAKNTFAKLCNLKNIDADVAWEKHLNKNILDKHKDNPWLKKIIDVIRG